METFDIFLSHNSTDKDLVERVAEELQTEGVKPWLDKWCLVPGQPFQDQLANALKSCKTCGIFVGQNGIGDWAREELRFAQDRAAKNSAFGLIPILLPGVPEPFDYSELPPFLTQRTWVDFRRGFDEPRLLRQLIKAIEGLPPGPDRSVSSKDQKCPYRGLETFNEEHADFFFGRERDIQRLLEKLKGTRFLAVLGASGSGKSSLVRAGVIPALKEGALPESDAWAIRVFTPGSHPLTTLGAQVLRLCPTEQTMHTTVDKMAEDERTLHLGIAFALAGQKAGHIALVIDQSEEVFTLCSDEKERAQFLANLLYASSIPDGRCTVLLTMRADFLPKCASYAELAGRIAAQQFLVSPMDVEMLRQVINEPARRVGLTFEPGLVDTILSDVASEPGALPLLEHALLELWKRRNDHRLTLESYHESGGVRGAIAKTAEETFKGLTPEEQPIIRRIMLRLTQLGEGTEDTRRRALLTELVTKPEEADAVNRITRLMTDARLLITGRDSEDVNVAHEALIRGWPRLRQWLDEDPVGLRLHHRISESAQEWRRSNKENGILYRGAKLTQAQEWRERNEAELNPLEREFLDASIAERQKSERQQRQRQRLLIGAAVLFAFLAIFGFWQKQEAELKNRELGSLLEAEARSDRLVAEEKLQGGMDADALAYLGRASRYVSKSSLPAEAAMPAVLSSAIVHSQAMFQGHTDVVHSAVFSPDGRWILTASDDKTARLWDAATGLAIGEPMKHEGAVNSAQFSPDGQRVVTASKDQTARLWEAESGKFLATFQGHTDGVYSAVFSPDGRRVLTASGDKTVRLWEAESGKLLTTLQGHTSWVYSAVFSPDGRRVLTASDDNTARLWEADGSGKLLTTFQGHTSGVNSVVFSPDGRWVLTASRDKTARLWEAESGNPLATFQGHTDGVYSAVFSPDGRRVLTASGDQTARLWEAESGKLLATFQGHTSGVNSAVFSPDGRRVLTASRDKTARLWEAESGKLLPTFQGHTNSVHSAIFSPDGRRVLTASRDNTARLWEAESGKLLVTFHGYTNKFYGAVFSSDGRRVLTASADNTARLWEADGSGKLLTTFQGHTDAVYSAVFSPDGRRVLTASDDNTARLWEAESGKLLTTFQGHTCGVYSAVFSPDGRRVLTASADNTARLWEAESGKLLTTFQGHTSWVYSAIFSPDGRRVLTASDDNTARLWEADGSGKKPLATLQGHTDSVHSAIFSPDGRRVLTASRDKTARLWEAESGKLLATLQAHTSGVNSAVFSPDGKRLLTAADDKTARLWEAESGKLLTTFQGHTSGVNSAIFSPDGRRVLTASGDSTARLWPLLPAGVPPPDWCSDFLIWLGGKQIAPDGQIETLSENELVKLEARLRPHMNENTDYARLLRWRLVPPQQGPVDPYGTITREQMADLIIRSGINSAEAQHAYDLDPWHPLVQLVLASFEKDPVRADFLEHYSLNRLPKDSKLRQRAKEFRRGEVNPDLAEVKILHLQKLPNILAIWKEAAQQYERAHPGVKIRFDYLENEAFKARLPTLLQSKDRPSAFHSWGGGVMYEQINAGVCQDITKAITEDGFKDAFYPAGIQNFTYQGKTYGLPNDVAPIVFWYNKELCQKAGVDPQKIKYWDDFVEAVKKCQTAGVTPVAAGGKDKWPLHFYPTFLMMRIMGKEGMKAACEGKNGGFAGPDASKAFQLYNDFAALQPFQKGYLTNTYAESGGAFHDGKTAFHLMGTWDITEGRSNAADQKGLPDEKLGWIFFPEVKGGKGHANDIFASVDGWLVVKEAPPETADFMRVWLGKEIQSKLAEQGLFIPMVKGTADAIKDPFLKVIAAEVEKSQWIAIAMDQLLGPDTGRVFNDASADVAAGKISPEKAAKAIEQAWEQNKM